MQQAGGSAGMDDLIGEERRNAKADRGAGDGLGRVGSGRGRALLACCWACCVLPACLCEVKQGFVERGPHCWSSHDGLNMLVANQPLVRYEGALKGQRPGSLGAWVPGVWLSRCVGLQAVLLTEESLRGFDCDWCSEAVAYYVLLEFPQVVLPISTMVEVLECACGQSLHKIAVWSRRLFSRASTAIVAESSRP